MGASERGWRAAGTQPPARRSGALYHDFPSRGRAERGAAKFFSGPAIFGFDTASGWWQLAGPRPTTMPRKDLGAAKPEWGTKRTRDKCGARFPLPRGGEPPYFTGPRGGRGAVAQLGERYNGIVEVRGSIPLGSTKSIKGLVGSG